MKRTLVRSTFATVLPLLMLVIGVQTTVSAQSVKAHNNNARHNRIVGVWDVEVAVLDCTTGTELATFPGLHKYELGGTAQVVPATNPAAQSAHMGIWRPVRKNEYQLTFKMFRFDTAGKYIGWTVVKNDIAISEDGSEYTGSGVAELFDPNGNSVGKSCPTFAGMRLQR
jgi:hypothetical protein